MFGLKTKTHIKFKIQAFSPVVVIIVLSSFLLAFQYYNPTRILSEAANTTSYSSGQISIEKKYFNGTSELDSTTINTNSSLTIRLKYNNTGTQSATNVKIQDSIPNGFSLVSGSLKNCYSDLSCVNLNDNLFSAGLLNVAPGAGYFGYNTDNSLSSSNLEMGKKKYLNIVRCQDGVGNGDWFIPFGNNGLGSTLGLSNTAGLSLTQMRLNQADYCSGPEETFLNSSFIIRGNRYIHQVKCEESTNNLYFGDWKIPTNTNAQSISLGVNNISTTLNQSDILYTTPDYCISSNSTFSSLVLDSLGKRYVHQIKCVDPVYFGDTYIPGDNLGLSNSSSVLTLAQVQEKSNSFCTQPDQVFESNIQDLLDTSSGNGYIEYRLTAPTSGGIFGSNVKMTGSFDTQGVEDESKFSISVGTDLTCPYVYPIGGVRQVVLGDAELLSDQDFSCNYAASICFIIFQDTNQNGIQDSDENRIAGVTVKLMSQDGLLEIYSTLSSDSVQQCFEPLRNEVIYKLKVVNPPTPFSTTGGDEVEVGVTYQSGKADINFGYTSGSISLSAQRSVSLGSIQVSDQPQTLCTTIYNIQIIDTRLNKPGWNVTATVGDFVDLANPNNIIPVAGKLVLAPKTVTIVSGDDLGISPGQSKQITSTSDPVNVFSASSNNGAGTYKTEMDLCLTIPAFSRLGQYVTTVNFVV